MIVKVLENQRVPADMVVIDSSQDNVFISTDQLDGETDWKLRRPIPKAATSIEYPNEPIANIYQFDATASGVPITLENVLWCGTVCKTDVWGLVIYCGSQTRIALQSSRHRQKLGIFDQEVNTLCKLLFLLMILLTSIVTIFSSGNYQTWQIIPTFMRYMILLSNVIPVSMRVNLEFAKLVYSRVINKDEGIPGTLARNSNIPESLGRI